MVVFKQKKIIATKSLGEDLQKARQALRLSLLAVEKKVGINCKYLEALENNEYDVISGEVYARNFLKKYAQFLNLNWIEIKEKYYQELIRQDIWQQAVNNKFGVTRKKQFIIFPKILRNIFFVLAVLIVVGYLTSQIWLLLSPPKLEILYPEDRIVLSNKFVKILGKTSQEVNLTLNDQEISIQKDGFFQIDINLNTGLNIIKITAKKRYGRSKVEFRHIIVQ